jgi:hypothetical protein
MNTKKIMNIKVTSELSKEDLTNIIKKSKPKGATHIRFTKEGGKRGKIDAVKEAEHYAGIAGSIEFGTYIGATEKSRKFAPLEIIVKEGPAANKKPKVENTGLNSFMFSLLLTEVTQAEGDEYPRSKYNVDEAVELVLKQYPDKDPVSAKKMIRVKPRALERMKTKEGEPFDDADPARRAPRWKLARPV